MRSTRSLFYNNESLTSINKFRVKMGMKPIVHTEKKCIKGSCGKKFLSEGPHQRMCDTCRWTTSEDDGSYSQSKP